MKIQFLKDCELELVVSFDEATETTETEDFCIKHGDTYEIDVERIGNETSSFQFGDGSMAYNVPNNLFDIIELELGEAHVADDGMVIVKKGNKFWLNFGYDEAGPFDTREEAEQDKALFTGEHDGSEQDI